jgi:hypothetical protein
VILGRPSGVAGSRRVNERIIMTEQKDSGRSDRIEQLLRRYPDIGTVEVEEIVHFLKKGSHLEVGLLSARDGIRPRLEAFRRDQRKHFALGIKDYVLFLTATVAPLAAICWYVWSRVHAV